MMRANSTPLQASVERISASEASCCCCCWKVLPSTSATAEEELSPVPLPNTDAAALDDTCGCGVCPAASVSKWSLLSADALLVLLVVLSAVGDGATAAALELSEWTSVASDEKLDSSALVAAGEFRSAAESRALEKDACEPEEAYSCGGTSSLRRIAACCASDGDEFWDEAFCRCGAERVSGAVEEPPGPAASRARGRDAANPAATATGAPVEAVVGPALPVGAGEPDGDSDGDGEWFELRLLAAVSVRLLSPRSCDEDVPVPPAVPDLRPIFRWWCLWLWCLLLLSGITCFELPVPPSSRSRTLSGCCCCVSLEFGSRECAAAWLPTPSGRNVAFKAAPVAPVPRRSSSSSSSTPSSWSVCDCDGGGVGVRERERDGIDSPSSALSQSHVADRIAPAPNRGTATGTPTPRPPPTPSPPTPTPAGRTPKPYSCCCCCCAWAEASGIGMWPIIFG